MRKQVPWFIAELVLVLFPSLLSVCKKHHTGVESKNKVITVAGRLLMTKVRQVGYLRQRGYATDAINVFMYTPEKFSHLRDDLSRMVQLPDLALLLKLWPVGFIDGACLNLTSQSSPNSHPAEQLADLHDAIDAPVSEAKELDEDGGEECEEAVGNAVGSDRSADGSAAAALPGIHPDAHVAQIVPASGEVADNTGAASEDFDGFGAEDDEAGDDGSASPLPCPDGEDGAGALMADEGKSSKGDSDVDVHVQSARERSFPVSGPKLFAWMKKESYLVASGPRYSRHCGMSHVHVNDYQVSSKIFLKKHDALSTGTAPTIMIQTVCMEFGCEQPPGSSHDEVRALPYKDVWKMSHLSPPTTFPTLSLPSSPNIRRADRKRYVGYLLLADAIDLWMNISRVAGKILHGRRNSPCSRLGFRIGTVQRELLEDRFVISFQGRDERPGWVMLRFLFHLNERSKFCARRLLQARTWRRQAGNRWEK